MEVSLLQFLSTTRIKQHGAFSPHCLCPSNSQIKTEASDLNLCLPSSSPGMSSGAQVCLYHPTHLIRMGGKLVPSFWLIRSLLLRTKKKKNALLKINIAQYNFSFISSN